jgi:hypothetical protein
LPLPSSAIAYTVPPPLPIGPVSAKLLKS